MVDLTLKDQLELIDFDYDLPLYHGTNMDFDSDNVMVFDSNKNDYAKEMWDSFYLTRDKEMAKKYAVAMYIKNMRKGRIIVKKFRIKPEALAKNISIALYLESNERTVDFIRQNIKKETLADCISKEKDCYNCELECLRNSEFVYGLLCDGVIDEILDGIKGGFTDEQLNQIIWNELSLKRGYQLGIRKMAVNCIEGRGTDYYSEDDPEISYLIPNKDVK